MALKLAEVGSSRAISGTTLEIGREQVRIIFERIEKIDETNGTSPTVHSHISP